MKLKKKITIALSLLILFAALIVPQAEAKGTSEYKAVVKHLKTKYRAKKVKIPFVWLARFAVSVVRPAGVKSFSITLFEDLKFSRETVDKEMQAAMRNSFDANWSPIFHVRSREGQQAYMYMREAGKSVKIAVVTIDKEQAAVIRATFSPERLADFINNPKIFGISLDDKKSNVNNENPELKENSEKKDEEIKNND
jgi:hypothetical protein